MNNTIKAVAIGLLLFFGVPYLVEAVITREDLRKVETRASDPNSEPVVRPALARDKFIEGCDTAELAAYGIDGQAYCGCMYNLLEARYGVNGIINMGLNDTDAELQAVMEPMADQCVAAQATESI